MEKSQNEKFYEILKDFDIAMLITHFGDRLCARPMAIIHHEKNCNLWFIGYNVTEKMDEIRHDPRVHITCQRDHGKYLSLSGTALLTQDRSKIDQFWKESFKVWFPEGKEDPNITLVHVTAESGEYWDNSGTNKIKYIYSTAATYITGTTPQVTEAAQHGEVRF